MSRDIPIFYQTWKNLLFLHWNIPEEVIQDKLPPGLTVDTWNGKSYVGIIPFQMRNLRPVIGFPIPILSNFTEINLRTYVKDKYNRPGVWFFSLDTQNSLGNFIANTFFYLNYRFTKVSFKSYNNNHICKHLLPGDSSYQTYEWEETNSFFSPCEEPKSLEFFLSERYRLFSYDQKINRLYTGRISHKPYLLNRPILKNFSNDLIQFSGLNNIINKPPENVFACRKTNVTVFSICKV